MANFWLAHKNTFDSSLVSKYSLSLYVHLKHLYTCVNYGFYLI